MKKPNWKIPLFLSATLLVLGTFSYWLEYSHKPKEEKQKTAAKKPLSLPTEDTQIASFKIKSVKGLIEAKCDELAAKKCTTNSVANWTITYPETFKADSENVKTFLNAAASALATETIDLSDETPEKRKSLLDEYGLSDQKRTDLNAQFIEFTLENGKHLTAWFGVEHPLGDKTFVAAAENGVVNDKTIFLIANYFKNNFDHDATFFRDKTIFNFNSDAVESFTATTSGGKLDVEKKNGSWIVNGFPANFDRVKTLLSSIERMKAKDFPKEDLTKGLKPVDSYALKTKDTTITLALYEKNSGGKANAAKSQPPEQKHIYLKTSARPELFEVEPNNRNTIDKKVADLRENVLLSQIEKATATQLSLSGKNYKNELWFTNDKGIWAQKANPANAWKADPKKVSGLLDSLTMGRVKDFLKATPGPGTDEIKLQLGDAKSPNKFNFRFFKIKDLAYGQDLNTKHGEILLLDDTIKKALPFTEDSWKMK
jgi:hypothetical protein